MLIILLAVLVVVGFIFWLVATWPGVPLAERIARGFFLAASVVWAWMALSGGAGGR